MPSTGNTLLCNKIPIVLIDMLLHRIIECVNYVIQPGVMAAM
jgi:hypothetical protein